MRRGVETAGLCSIDATPARGGLLPSERSPLVCFVRCTEPAVVIIAK